MRPLAVRRACDARLAQVLRDYFAWATTTTMAHYPRSPDDVPAGLRIPRWSWDGLQSFSRNPCLRDDFSHGLQLRIDDDQPAWCPEGGELT